MAGAAALWKGDAAVLLAVALVAPAAPAAAGFVLIPQTAAAAALQATHTLKSLQMSSFNQV